MLPICRGRSRGGMRHGSCARSLPPASGGLPDRRRPSRQPRSGRPSLSATDLGRRRLSSVRSGVIHITSESGNPAPEDAGARPSVPSASSAPISKSNAANSFRAPSGRTVAGPADAATGGNGSTVRVNLLKTNVRPMRTQIARPNPRRKTRTAASTGPETGPKSRSSGRLSRQFQASDSF